MDNLIYEEMFFVILLLSFPIIIALLNYLFNKYGKNSFILDKIFKMLKALIIFFFKCLNFLSSYDTKFVDEVSKDIDEDFKVQNENEKN